jgi:ABC-2 type transport system ATP-binding protein
MTTAVSIEKVSKRFRLYHERASSVKERVVNRRRMAFEEFYALKDVSLEIGTSETAGLIGPNGSGKSTLLKCIAGIFLPDEGKITTRGRIASLLELGAGFHPDLTGRENVFLNASILGLTRKETEKHFDAIVAFSELDRFIDTQVRHYSSGMYVRLGFAVAVHVDPEILIVDEVLAVGDEPFQRKCLSRIRDFQRDGRTIVFVTHAVDLVREICTKAYFLHMGELTAEGRPTDVVDAFRRTVHGANLDDIVALDDRGTGEAHIDEVRFIGSNGEDRQVYEPGESMEIRAKLSLREPIDDPVLGCIVYDDSGRYLWGTNTALRDLSVGRLNGDTIVKWKIPALPVVNTTCAVTLAVSSKNGQDYHWREKGWAFKVVSKGADLGRVHFDVQLEVEPA